MKCKRCNQNSLIPFILQDEKICENCMDEWLELLKKVIARFLNNQPILFQETIIEDD